LHEEVALSRRELGVIESDIATLQTTWQEARAQAEEAERQVKELHTRLEEAEHALRELDHRRHQQQHEVTLAKVALATVEERLSALRAKHGQLETDLGQRRQELTDAERRLLEARQRLQQSQGTMLNASAALARCYLDKESAERRVDFLARERDQQRQERQAIVERVQAARGEWQARQEEVHSHELTASELRHKRDTMVDRLREDYQLDLAELYVARQAERQAELESAAPPSDAVVTDVQAVESEMPENSEEPETPPIPLDPAAVNEEIAELKRKLNRLGSVNLDSLQELADLEVRAENLQTQFDDLGAAKKSLEEIIATINQDSKRLFTETFTTIRMHFQELFRKVFGGGMADILLENEEDVLESGIEIVARPPGKELRSISLMSGGEKTMAAVALLLAIFRSKPSPFCILDEVDAALDEANIGRYTAVLREFLDLSQFIIITHSKRTMSCADVLYGITMQESGISKRVAVKFEDWPDDPPPAPPAETNGEGAFAGR
jgi:chromosome segregation protein